MQGALDPWCEMAESDQMYAALKIQGKDVVQIRWNNEAHGVRSFPNRIQNYSILLEWFDKYLKNQSEGWENRYKRDKFRYR